MIVYPAIDIQNNNCVRLHQGAFDRVTIYSKDPVAIAMKYQENGADYLHLVDLDGARTGVPMPSVLLNNLLSNTTLKIQMGGGIRDFAYAKTLLECGVSRIVIGSLAIQNPHEVKRWIPLFSPHRIVLALDIRWGNDQMPCVTTEGWQHQSNQSLWSILDDYANTGAIHVLCTDVTRDGTLCGPNFDLYDACVKRYPTLQFQASGGVTTLQDLVTLEKIGVAGAVIGKALYEKTISLTDAIIFSKNKLTKRIIPCLDVRDGKVVKGVQFRQHEVMGDVAPLAQHYVNTGADELVFYDISASAKNQCVDAAWISEIARHIDIPFCVAGGIRTVNNAKTILEAGADKISINSPALKNPHFISELVKIFGQQCIVVGIDSYLNENGDYIVCQYTGDEHTSRQTAYDTQDWIEEVQQRGAGEIVLNCMNRDGMRSGYDIVQLHRMRTITHIPLIASGGAGSMQDFVDVFKKADVDGALAASVFHRQLIEIPDLKKYLYQNNVRVRL